MPTKLEKNLQACESASKVLALSPGLKSPIDHLFDLAKTPTTAGLWYFGGECEQCKRTSPAFRDFSEGKMGNPFHGSGYLRFPCHFCSAQIRLPPHQFVTFQWV